MSYKFYKVENEIIITGFQSNPYSFIDASDIYVQPSRAEMYPLTILEALVLKKTIISTGTAGGNYILNKYNCGFLVENPVREISSIIEDLANNPVKIDEERKKTELIDWKADEERYLNQLEQLLCGVIEEKRGN